MRDFPAKKKFKGTISKRKQFTGRHRLNMRWPDASEEGDINAQNSSLLTYDLHIPGLRCHSCFCTCLCGFPPVSLRQWTLLPEATATAEESPHGCGEEVRMVASQHNIRLDGRCVTSNAKRSFSASSIHNHKTIHPQQIYSSCFTHSTLIFHFN